MKGNWWGEKDYVLKMPFFQRDQTTLWISVVFEMRNLSEDSEIISPLASLSPRCGIIDKHKYLYSE